jgi:hypothetical protein
VPLPSSVTSDVPIIHPTTKEEKINSGSITDYIQWVLFLISKLILISKILALMKAWI